MTVFVVTWNLNKERSNYAAARNDFIKHLERCDNKGDPDLESVRFISASSTANEVAKFLQQKLDNNDGLFVSKLNLNEYQGLLNADVWEWIKRRL